MWNPCLAWRNRWMGMFAVLLLIYQTRPYWFSWKSLAYFTHYFIFFDPRPLAKKLTWQNSYNYYHCCIITTPLSLSLTHTHKDTVGSRRGGVCMRVMLVSLLCILNFRRFQFGFSCFLFNSSYITHDTSTSPFLLAHVT